MSKQVNCIMLIDDNKDDNYFHERVIRTMNAATRVVVKETAEEALDFLRNKKTKTESHENLIFLDINMPGMNGWEFLEEYKNIDKTTLGKTVVVMLSTSDNPDDKALAKTWSVLSDFRTKPLTKTMLSEILDLYF